jgi:perosamine synthetase
MKKLAINGGNSVINYPLAPFNKIGEEEIQSVTKVMKTGVLSGFIGAPGEDFFGGRNIIELESIFCDMFSVPYAISVNSATSGLYAAMGAIGLSPGDEVIVPPYTMSATAMAPLLYGGIPVFADIEEDNFCLDLQSVVKQITKKTKAIIVVNLCGHPAKLHELARLAKQHGIYLIEDNAQAPFAKEFEKFTGTIGDIGIFSLNRHKHIQCGEGGVCLTSNEHLAQRLSLIRNHGENLVEHHNIDNIENLIGFNYRMTEIDAAISICQLRKAETIIEERRYFAEQLIDGIKVLPGIGMPITRDGCKHVYYSFIMRFSEDIVGISRNQFCTALIAEGVPINQGYLKPLYQLPVFQKRIAIGKQGFPFNMSDRNYEKGMCPVVERMYEKEEMGFGICSFELSDKDIKNIIDAFHKVYDAKQSIR